MVTSDAGHNDRPRNGRGRFVRSPDTAVRDAAAARLRVEGHTFQQIADRLGYRHRGLARRAVERALMGTIRESADELRALELARLDEMWCRSWSVMATPYATVSGGRVVRDGDGKVVPDWKPILDAIDRLLKIMERRARLLGLDAPRKVSGWSIAEIEAEIARLEEGDAA